MNLCPSRRNVQSCVKRLEKKGIVPHSDPYTCIHEKIEFVCSSNITHRFFWDLEDVVHRLRRCSRLHDTICPDCVKLAHHVQRQCSRLGVKLIHHDQTHCSLLAPSCGHVFDLEIRKLVSMESVDCSVCSRKRHNLFSLLKRLDEVRSRGRFDEQDKDARLIIQDVLSLLKTKHDIICVHPFHYDEEARDLLVSLDCPCHHVNTTTLRGVLSLMIAVDRGDLSSPCPDCHLLN